MSICSQQILNEILRRVKESPYFSILVDETTDIAGLEQMCICVRYVYEERIHEDFLTFAEVHDMTGKELSKTIIDALNSFDLDLLKIVGQGMVRCCGAC